MEGADHLVWPTHHSEPREDVVHQHDMIAASHEDGHAASEDGHAGTDDIHAAK